MSGADGTAALARRARDLADAADRNGRVTATKFLTEEETAFLAGFCRREGIRAVFDGGRPGAERRVALFLPFWADEESAGEDSPVAALRFSWGGGEVLTHRDFLGALMAAGVRRDAVGDIAVAEGEAFVVCLTDVAGFIAETVTSAGRARVRAVPARREEIPAPADDGTEVTVSLASLRLDAVTAAGWRLSREDAKALILSGAVSVDHVPAEKPDAELGEGSLVSVRGKGRLRVTALRGNTRRGRLAVTLTRWGG